MYAFGFFCARREAYRDARGCFLINRSSNGVRVIDWDGLQRVVVGFLELREVLCLEENYNFSLRATFFLVG
jgi:hypothetical protein